MDSIFPESLTPRISPTTQFQLGHFSQLTRSDDHVWRHVVVPEQTSSFQMSDGVDRRLERDPQAVVGPQVQYFLMGGGDGRHGAIAALQDRIQRMVRDSICKLSPRERLISPAVMAEHYGLPRAWIAKGFVAALKYTHPTTSLAPPLCLPRPRLPMLPIGTCYAPFPSFAGLTFWY